MMTETKQTVDNSAIAPQVEPCPQPLIDLRVHEVSPEENRPSPDILQMLAIGSPQGVNNFVMTMFQLGYAHPEEWSRQLPTVNPGEVMRILTKRVMLSD